MHQPKTDNCQLKTKKMKRKILLSLCGLFALCVMAQTQVGYVKTPGRMDGDKRVPGKGLTDALVRTQDRSIVVKNANGSFSFPVPSRQYVIKAVKKNGYQPFDARFCLNEASVHNEQLPPMHDAVITLELDNEIKGDTVKVIDELGVFVNIPHRFLGQDVHVTCCCPDFLPVDTTLNLTRDVTLNLYRDPSVYGNVHFGLWDPETENFIPDSKVEIAGQTVTSDKDGQVTLFVPLEAQRASYQVKAEFPLYNDMVPMPSGENTVVEKL